MLGVSLFQGFRSSGAQEYQMSGNNIVIMPSPRKVIIMNMEGNTGVRCNSIQLGVTISGQMCLYHVKACQVSDSMSIIKCHISDVRYQVSSDTCQVPVSDIKCQISGFKYNRSSAGVRYQVSSIRCQV